MTENLLEDGAAANIAAAALGISTAQIVRVERIKHGLTNDSWRVLTKSDAVIVRISNAAEALLQIDRRSEATVLQLVAAAGLGPEVLVCDVARRVLVTRDLGRTWDEKDARLAANISRLGGYCATYMHCRFQPVCGALPWWRPCAGICEHWTNAAIARD